MTASTGSLQPRRALSAGADAIRRASTAGPWWQRPQVLLALLVIHILLGWFSRAPGIMPPADASRYLVLARAIGRGTYRDLMWPGAPLEHMYPPGYPALLGLWTAIGGENVNWLIVLHLGLTSATIALIFTAVRAVSPLIALCTTIILSVNPHLTEGAGPAESDSALAVCTAIAVWAATCLPRGRRQTATVLAAAVAAPLMRTVGVVVPVAVVIHWAMDRRYRDALLAGALSAVVVIPSVVWMLLEPDKAAGASYVADLVVTNGAHPTVWGELARRVAANTFFYVTQGLPWTFPTPTVPGTLVDNVAGCLLIIVGLAMGIGPAFRRFRLGLLVLLAAGGVFLVWPYQDPRYLEPFLPIIVPIWLCGLVRAASRLRVPAPTTAFGATVIIAGSGLAATVQDAVSLLGCHRRQALPDARCVSPQEASFFRAAEYVRDHLPSDARIVSGNSEALYYHTRRVTVPAARVSGSDSARFLSAIREAGAAYVLLAALQRYEHERLAPRLAARCRSLRVVASFPPHALLLDVTTPTAYPAAAPKNGAADATTNDGACAAIAAYQRATPPQEQSTPIPFGH